MQDRAKPQKKNLTSLTLSEMVAGIRQKTVSPLDLVEAHLDQITRLNPQLNAFVYVDEEAARRQARAAESAILRGEALGPLYGVPLSIKSSIDVAGWPIWCGSKLRKHCVAVEDAPLVSRLRRAGAILLGNTNAPEFLMAYETDNVVTGRTNNPWNLSRTPGGSSGGEAAAIAAHCSAGGVGSDGGGSIRVPAHYSGICGLKPTPGRIPATGHFPASAGPFALLGVVGPLARTVGDLSVLFEIMMGPDCGDSFSAPIPMRQPAQTEILKLRIGFFEEDGRTPVTAETRAAVRKAISALVNAGMTVEPFLPEGLEEARRIWWNFFGRAGEFVLGPMVAGQEADLSPLFAEFLGNVRKEPKLTLNELMNTMLERDALRPKFLRQMEKYPVLICPVCSVPAFRHGERVWDVGERKVDYFQAMSYCQWFNALGNPAAVVPVGRSPEGLPIGVQVVGRPYEEEIVLAVARIIEETSGNSCDPPLL
ncbi:MAG: amidase [Candidatus Acidiferrales bacterium]